MKTVIMGLGHYLPERVVTNHELTKLMDTSDQWIVERTGIKERRWIDKEMGGSDMSLVATYEAVEQAGISVEQIECIIYATLSPDHNFPGSGCFLQEKLRLPGIPALDVRNQCSGFLYGLSVADAWIKSGQYNRVLLVGAEVHSTGLDVSTPGRDVACLFGDAAACVVLGKGPQEEPERGILSTHLHADGRYATSLWIEAPASRLYPERLTQKMVAEGRHYPKMRGRHVYTMALQKMPEVIQEALDKHRLSLNDVDLIVPHQANQRITEQVGKLLGVEDKMFSNIEKMGNTTAASIPLALYQAEKMGKIRKGQLVLLVSFGAGFTWASAAIRW